MHQQDKNPPYGMHTGGGGLPLLLKFLESPRRADVKL